MGPQYTGAKNCMRREKRRRNTKGQWYCWLRRKRGIPNLVGAVGTTNVHGGGGYFIQFEPRLAVNAHLNAHLNARSVGEVT
jgi:hypothetical protein